MAARNSLGGLNRNSDDRFRVFAILVVISVVLFTISCREAGSGIISSVQGAASVIVSPVRGAGALVTVPFQAVGNLFSNLTAGEATLSELKAENERLIAENAALKEADAASERLEALLGIQSSYDLVSTGARVISGPTDSATSSIVIDKGSLAGIEVGMPVTDSMGLVGQVRSVTPTTATVLLVTDERSGVSAMVQESRAHGEVVGSAAGTLSLAMVTPELTVNEGDLVITSGLGGVYPKGLPIGVVTSVSRAEGDLYQTIRLRPVALTGAFEEVLVVTEVSQEQRATAEEAEEAQGQEIGDLAQATDADGPGDDEGESAPEGPSES